MKIPSLLMLVFFLVRAGFAQEAPAPDSLFHAAAAKGDLALLQELFEKGAELESKDSEGHTALDIAALSENPDCVIFLLEQGADASRSQVEMIEVYRQLGQYEEAMEQAETVLADLEKGGQTQTPGYPKALAFKGLIYWEQGELAKALSLILKATELTKTLAGEESTDYVSRLNNLGLIYGALHDPEKSIAAFAKAVEIAERIKGKENAFYVTLLENYAGQLVDLKRFEEALPMLIEGKEIFERVAGPDNMDYAFRVNNLGRCYYRMGRYEEALPYLEKATDLVGTHLGKDHPYYGLGLFNVAQTAYKSGNFRIALEKYRKSLQNVEQQLGPNHEQYGWVLSGLGKTYGQLNLLDSAQITYQALSQNLRFLAENQLPFLHESAQLSFSRGMAQDFNRINAFVLFHPEMTDLRAEAYENVLLQKGMLLSNKTRLLERIIKHPDPSIQDTYGEWLEIHTSLAAQYSIPLAQRTANLDSLQRVADELELILANRSLDFRTNHRLVDWESVQSNLTEGAVALEFDRVHEEMPGGERKEHYIAYIIAPGNSYPIMVNLCTGDQLETCFQQGDDRRVDYVAQLYALPSRGLTPVSDSLYTLYELIWEPLDSLLQGVTTIYYGASGLLHRINLGAIPLSLEETVADRYSLHNVGNTGRLAHRPLAMQYQGNKDAMIFADIAYDLDSLQMKGSIQAAPLSPDQSRRTVIRGGSGKTWAPLRFSQREMESTGAILEKAGYSVLRQTGYAASEDNFRLLEDRSRSPHILHFATHGYFFSDPGELEELDPDGAAFRSSQNPMVRSGLILAGANHVWTGNSPAEGLEDGILTAYEISLMPLPNTELVVLSACETGLGDLKGNEGVYGLQRAFALAGVRYLIMSLWQVPDFQTQDLMVTFYREWLENERSIPEAFEVAQQLMRQKYVDPYFWAGFILVE